MVAGPCAVESAAQLSEIARAVAAAGAGALRGGAYKPRTSPYSFQGLGRVGLELLQAAREETGLPVITELLDVRDAPAVAAVADVIQIGARNMHNVPLLVEAARIGVPVLLKRSAAATIDELLDAADYLLEEGCDDVILCERGIRTFETGTRYTLDISAVPQLRERTHLPVLVDPSHAAGDARLVPALARAAIAAGADGLLIEVHDDPDFALSDGPQSLVAAQFADVVDGIQAIVNALGQTWSLPRPAAATTGIA